MEIYSKKPTGFTRSVFSSYHGRHGCITADRCCCRRAPVLQYSGNDRNRKHRNPARSYPARKHWCRNRSSSSCIRPRHIFLSPDWTRRSQRSHPGNRMSTFSRRLSLYVFHFIRFFCLFLEVFIRFLTLFWSFYQICGMGFIFNCTNSISYDRIFTKK